ncbi:hypothetical protein B0H66DRAFT_228833 [Apodospora peruviana]|uniref:RING-type domain-containing protein n=1 Tax=Apodospora peruviana TaxID=516989 RepID=A0AAE0I4H6_9PEZI|nr:hypothetical protein B0H66DRAFT_228833 [Apodospora peruviana]
MASPGSDISETPNCSICLGEASEEASSKLLHVCICSAEYHPECLDKYVSIRERENNPLVCPACKRALAFDEPFDPVVALRNALHRRYSRTSPLILLMIISSGGIAGSAWYGWNAAATFAGTGPVVKWMFGRRGGSPAPAVLFKIWGLSLIGPGLVITRALPGLGSILAPASLFYATVLLARQEKPSWPPSPAWAMVLMPWVNRAYSWLYYASVGPLEKRLNRALHNGLSAQEAPGLPAGEGSAPVNNDDQTGDRREGGLWAAAVSVGQAVLRLSNGDNGAEVEIRVGGEVDDGGDQVQQEQQPPAQTEEQPSPPPEQQPPQPAQEVQHNQNQNQRQNDNNNNNNNNNNTFWPSMSGIINSLTTSLLFPGISYCMGELIRVVAPASWVNTIPTSMMRRQPRAGLLQHRWGRSLVGGCLFVVLKDAYPVDQGSSGQAETEAEDEDLSEKAEDCTFHARGSARDDRPGQ